jgi:hypothetical protein
VASKAPHFRPPAVTVQQRWLSHDEAAQLCAMTKPGFDGYVRPRIPEDCVTIFRGRIFFLGSAVIQALVDLRLEQQRRRTLTVGSDLTPR